MEWKDNEAQAAFREEVRAFIQERLPARYRRGDSNRWQSDRASDEPAAREAAMEWSRALGSKGWVAPHWPKEYGGAGMTPMEQFIFNEEMAKAGAPLAASIHGVAMIGPTMIVHGSKEQQAEHLQKILTGEVVWCQGYSEPGAGSDLASLQTRAVKDGDDFIINGQKIWTSGAQTADWVFFMARTNPDAPKHRGISFFVADLKTPGISVRPIINMADGDDLNETFFEDVRVPKANMVGEEDRGWYVGMTLLDFERSGISNAVGTLRTIRQLVDYAKGEGSDRARIEQFPSLRGEVADRMIECEVSYQFSLRIVSIQNAGQVPNHEASCAKLFNSELSQRIARTGTKVFGLYANLWDEEDARSPMRASHTHAYVNSIPSTIAGGSSEIQRGIIATRGLGLPRG
jgi:alkylation response protein AidB-like acyl-CoA dehydrogenase